MYYKFDLNKMNELYIFKLIERRNKMKSAIDLTSGDKRFEEYKRVLFDSDVIREEFKDDNMKHQEDIIRNLLFFKMYLVSFLSELDGIMYEKYDKMEGED